MRALIDTNIAILLRDGDPMIIDSYAELQSPPALSIVSQIELEGGIAARPDLAVRRRAALDALLVDREILDFDARAADAYRKIVAAIGYSRPRIIDRMIAATALAHGLSVITINRTDFQNIPGLDLIVWQASA